MWTPVQKLALKWWKNITVFSEKTGVPPPPKPFYGGNFNHDFVILKIGQGHQNLISYWSCTNNMDRQIW